ncbi:SIMPL domain-containing protein [Tenuibacillus multivorans]|uniref:DUF541 domain-containing protein n=1 Tax=Tenuibacillus multivorans TaxID=237069 RepID=A0A1H0AU45_9BACI|nr:SIMPL domain-containing protein [Tenuibacillus multivorans]GEL77821.1 putative conserved lipoprotein LpqG [Tenuibacillus multivorans]SDN36889.1 hypothetical protein SAMN05216498_2074 [Tenuibacillus multivorans]
MNYPANYGENGKTNKRVLTVVGEGIVTTEPNIAEVSLGVVRQGQELMLVQQENAEIIQQVISVIMMYGIPMENIPTIEYTVRPVYEYVDGEQQFHGYEVMHFLRIIISDISQVGSIIDAAVASGANQIMNINFSVAELDQYYREGLRRALRDATLKAETLASAINANLDLTPIKISEQIEAPPIIYRTFAQTEATGETPIEPGQLEIQVRIEAKFQYEK